MQLNPTDLFSVKFQKAGKSKRRDAIGMPLYVHALHKNACNTTRVTVGILIILKDKWWDPNSPPGPR